MCISILVKHNIQYHLHTHCKQTFISNGMYSKQLMLKKVFESGIREYVRSMNIIKYYVTKESLSNLSMMKDHVMSPLVGESMHTITILQKW